MYTTSIASAKKARLAILRRPPTTHQKSTIQDWLLVSFIFIAFLPSLSALPFAALDDSGDTCLHYTDHGILR